MNGDLERCIDVCRELLRLTFYRFEPRDFADRTLAMLLEHWGCVTALAEALVDERRIDGAQVKAIIDAA
jgi:hypothetical protein